jgi:hypothetical protein
MQTLILTPDDLTIEGRGVPYDELGLPHFNVDNDAIESHGIIMFVDADDDADDPIEIYLKTDTQ